MPFHIARLRPARHMLAQQMRPRVAGHWTGGDCHVTTASSRFDLPLTRTHRPTAHAASIKRKPASVRLRVRGWLGIVGYQSHAGVKAQWRCNYASVSFVANAFPTTAAKRKALAKLGHCTALYGLGVQIADVEISSSKICESLRLRLTYRRVGRFPHGVDSPQSTERKRSLIQYSKPDAAASFLCVATSALRPGQTFDSISGRGRTPFARTGTISASR